MKNAALITELEADIAKSFKVPPTYFSEPVDSFAEVKARFQETAAALLKAMEAPDG